jgi:hypothetical protein
MQTTRRHPNLLSETQAAKRLGIARITLLRAREHLPEIFMLPPARIHGSCHRLQKKLRAKPAMRRRGANFLRETGAPGAIPTRDLPLRSRIYEPFVFNSYEKA